MKILWYDTETTGLDSKLNDIITLSGIIEVDGEVKEEFDFKMRPFNPDNISLEALKVNGFTKEEIMSFPEPKEVKKQLDTILFKYVDRYKKFKTIEDKLIPAGHNIIKFDNLFLEEYYKKCGDNYLFSILDYHALDTVSLAMTLKILKVLKTENIKLQTLANLFEVPIVAHNSKSDITATREIFYKIAKRIQFTPLNIPVEGLIEGELGTGL